jgi:hypothetical protein
MFSAPPRRAEGGNAGGRKGEVDLFPARGKGCRGISIRSSVALLSHYIETWASNCRGVRRNGGALGSFPRRRDRHFARLHAATRVKIPPVMHGKFGHGRLPLAKGRSMQIRHEISLIVVCRMTEAGNRPFCGPGSDRPKTATRRRCRATTDAALKRPFTS